jgi:hypothetical protein
MAFAMHLVPVQMGAANAVLQDKGCGCLSCAMMATVIVIFADAENQSLLHIFMTSGIALGYHEICDGTRYRHGSAIYYSLMSVPGTVTEVS